MRSASGICSRRGAVLAEHGQLEVLARRRAGGVSGAHKDTVRSESVRLELVGAYLPGLEGPGTPGGGAGERHNMSTGGDVLIELHRGEDPGITADTDDPASPSQRPGRGDHRPQLGSGRPRTPLIAH